MIRWLAQEISEYSYPHQLVPMLSAGKDDIGALQEALSGRINRNSALWT
jgi:hypothetical protein